MLFRTNPIQELSCGIRKDRMEVANMVLLEDCKSTETANMPESILTWDSGMTSETSMR